jgi:hypothetical protein
MKKQSILAGVIVAAFILAAAGASFAGDRRGSHPGNRHWKGKHFAAKPYSGQWKRNPAAPHHKGQWQRRPPVPRHRLNHRGAPQRPGYRGSDQHFGHRPGNRHDGRWQPSNHQQTNAAFGRQHDRRGDNGQDRARHAFERSDRQGGSNDDAAIAADDTSSSNGGRNSSGRQRQL